EVGQENGGTSSGTRTVLAQGQWTAAAGGRTGAGDISARYSDRKSVPSHLSPPFSSRSRARAHVGGAAGRSGVFSGQPEGYLQAQTDDAPRRRRVDRQRRPLLSVFFRKRVRGARLRPRLHEARIASLERKSAGRAWQPRRPHPGEERRAAECRGGIFAGKGENERKGKPACLRMVEVKKNGEPTNQEKKSDRTRSRRRQRALPARGRRAQRRDPALRARRTDPGRAGSHPGTAGFRDARETSRPVGGERG